MSERKTGKPVPADNEYFLLLFGSLLRQVEELGVSPDRLEEIDNLARSFPDDKLKGQTPAMVAQKGDLTANEKMVFSSLIKARQEINQATKEGELNLKEAERWRRIFGFNQGGRIIMTTEGLTEEERDILAQTKRGLPAVKKGRKAELAREEDRDKLLLEQLRQS